MENVYVCGHSILALGTMSSIERKLYRQEDTILQPLALHDFLLWEYFKSSSTFIHLFLYLGGKHAGATTRMWRSENSLWVFSFHHVGPGNQITSSGLKNKDLNHLNHFASHDISTFCSKESMRKDRVTFYILNQISFSGKKGM